jgi:uncharacterized protein (TIGR02466 family)
MSKVAKKPKVCKAAESVAEVVLQTQLQVAHHFPCPIYIIERPDFLETVNAVSEEGLAESRKAQSLNEIYPVVMSGNFFGDPRMARFSEFVGATAWNILNEQGYAMEDKVVQFTEMWTQEHYKHSSMEQHVHGFGVQIVGFYFLEAPEDSSRVVFHDPRSGKVQNDLPEQNMINATPASRMVNFEAKEGRLIFSNSWLPHSFTRHASDKPVKFVHFNLTVTQAHPTCTMPAAEVI